MQLEEYLTILKECSDELLLRDELGVYDNFNILLKANYNTVVKDLLNFENFKLEKSMKIDERERSVLVVDGGIEEGGVDIQVFSYVTPFSTTGYGYNLTEEDVKHSQRQLKDYNMSMRLHQYDMEKHIFDLKKIAMVIQVIGKYILEKQIPACFPESVGRSHSKDYSRIIYHQPQ